MKRQRPANEDEEIDANDEVDSEAFDEFSFGDFLDYIKEQVASEAGHIDVQAELDISELLATINGEPADLKAKARIIADEIGYFMELHWKCIDLFLKLAP